MKYTFYILVWCAVVSLLLWSWSQREVFACNDNIEYSAMHTKREQKCVPVLTRVLHARAMRASPAGGVALMYTWRLLLWLLDADIRAQPPLFSKSPRE